MGMQVVLIAAAVIAAIAIIFYLTNPRMSTQVENYCGGSCPSLKRNLNYCIRRNPYAPAGSKDGLSFYQNILL